MPLTNFAVVHEHSEPLNRYSLLLRPEDDPRIFPREATDDYFRYTSLSPRDRNLLIARNLENLIPVIVAKYDRDEIGEYFGNGGQRFPQADICLADLERALEGLTDRVLDMAARAGFQRG